MAARRVAVLGMMGALLVLVQVAISFVPNVELVSLLVIVYTLLLGTYAFAPIYAFVIVEGLIYGFGLWWMNYAYTWAVLAGVVLLLRNQKSPYFWAVVSGLFGLFFGALCAIPYLFMGGLSSAFAYWITGIPFDIAHCIGNAAAVLLLFKPCYNIFERMLHSGWGSLSNGVGHLK